MTFWAFFLLAVAIYCGVQSFRDVRRKQYVSAALGAAAMVGLLVLQFPSLTQVVRIDVLTPVNR